MSKILILANHYNTLRIFRRELIQKLALQGHDITISIPPCEDENKDLLISYGTKVVFTPMERRGMNPIKDISLLHRYKKLIKKINPDKVITYTVKCNIYGSIICKYQKISHYVNITGLGSAFQSEGFAKKLLCFLYKHSINKANKVFFENIGNRDTMFNLGLVNLDQTVVLPGAGVNLTEFSFSPYPKNDSKIVFLFIGRVMKEKGVEELFYSIKKIKEQYKNVSLGILGWYEDNYKELVETLAAENFVEFYGFQSDVTPYINAAHCIVLPSYHEGMSNALLEAGAIGRPLITTNIHGCKESVKNEYNGYLCEVKNKESLYNAMVTFINLPYDDKKNMGNNSRTFIEKNFDKNDVVNKTISSLDF